MSFLRISTGSCGRLRKSERRTFRRALGLIEAMMPDQAIGRNASTGAGFHDINTIQVPAL